MELCGCKWCLNKCLVTCIYFDETTGKRLLVFTQGTLFLVIWERSIQWYDGKSYQLCKCHISYEWIRGTVRLLTMLKLIIKGYPYISAQRLCSTKSVISLSPIKILVTLHYWCILICHTTCSFLSDFIFLFSAVYQVTDLLVNYLHADSKSGFE